jgi:hypothetical protein
LLSLLCHNYLIAFEQQYGDYTMGTGSFYPDWLVAPADISGPLA